jgi:DNA replication protein DnaC
MRTLDAIDADIARLGRPVHPGCAGSLDPKAMRAWSESRDAWRLANPEGEERYALLLEEREAVEIAMVRNRAAASRAKQLAIPQRTRDALASMKSLPVTEAAAAWVAGAKQWLVLAGAVGTGKSVAAAHALTLSASQGRSGAWMSSTALAVTVGGFNGVSECERLKHVDVLVLDDFGTEHLSSFVEGVFFEVLAARHESGVRTILTHNLSRHAFRQRLGSRLADRVAADCDYVECTGASMRRAS